MNRNLCATLALLAFALQTSAQQWTQLTAYPAPGAPVTGMLATGNHLFVVNPGANSTGTVPGVVQSLDGGNSWQRADSNIPGAYSGLTIYYDDYRNTLIYGSGAQNGCYTATDLNNPVWTRNPAFIRPNCFARTDTTLYFTDAVSGIFRTTDDCATFRAITPATAQPYAYAIVSKNDTLIASMQFGGTFRSVNKGGTWTASGSGLNGAFINTYFVKDHYVFAGSYYYGVFRSGDNGATWTTANNGLPAALANRNFTCFAAMQDSLFAGGDTLGVYLSTDNGGSWQPFRTGMPAVCNVSRMTVANGRLFAGTTDGKVYRLDPAAAPNAVGQVNVRPDLRIAPVPAGDKLHIYNRGGGLLPVTLTNMTGAVCLAGLLNGPDSSLDVAQLPAGLYFLQAADGRRAKVVICH